MVIQPIDTVLTRLQANTIPKIDAVANPTSIKMTSKPTVEAIPLRPSTIFRTMISNFGISSLWRGSSAMIGAVPVQNALLMTGYGVGKRWSGADDEISRGNSANLLVGVFIGGCTGETVTYNQNAFA